jgi:uncharacterized membrane protein YbhN (UPF0104 family)
VALPFVISPSWTQNLVLGVVAVILLLLLVLLLLLWQRRRVIGVLSRLPGRGLWGLDAIAEDFITGLESSLVAGRLLRAAFWSLVAWGTAWLQIWFLLQAFNLAGTLIVSLFVTGVIAFGAALPSSPGAIGVFELSAVAGLLVFGFARETALGVAITAHILQLAITSAIGAWALAQEGQTLIGLAERTQARFRKVENRSPL